MRRERRRKGAEFIEQLLLPVVNIVFLLIPVLLVVIELTSFAALQASTPDAPQAAQAPAIQRTSAPQEPPLPEDEQPEERSDAPAPSPPPVPFPDHILGYGF